MRTEPHVYSNNMLSWCLVLRFLGVSARQLVYHFETRLGSVLFGICVRWWWFVSRNGGRVFGRHCKHAWGLLRKFIDKIRANGFVTEVIAVFFDIENAEAGKHAYFFVPVVGGLFFLFGNEQVAFGFVYRSVVYRSHDTFR